MQNYLVDHALRNVWCAPAQDNQVIIEPARITNSSGVLAKCSVMWKTVYLPDSTSRWHVYQIGQIHPMLLGLKFNGAQWTKFSDACNYLKLICDIYTIDGVNIPRIDTYYQFTSDRDLIIAVKKNDKLPINFSTDKIYLRLYTNAYFNSLRSNASTDVVVVQGKKANTTQDILDLQNDFEAQAALPGATYCFVNGVKKDKIDVFTMGVGDTGEFIRDASIYKVVDFLVRDTPTFESILDLKRKYLLHYTGSDNNTIDYQDDVDVFIIHKFNSTRHRGLYYHKNNEDAMRMVTHRDYSVCVPYIVTYADRIEKASNISTPINPNEVTIRLHIRKSGFQRSLVFENNRIKELYKLQETDIMKAFLGIDSTVPVWRADNLENSGYTKIMRVPCEEVTLELVQQAYGYNALSKVLNDTPTVLSNVSGHYQCPVPYGFEVNSTAYEYDADGYLIDYYPHQIGAIYNAANPNTRIVEFISGIGGSQIDEKYNPTTANLSDLASYKVYGCNIVAGVPDNKFTDITDRTDLFTKTLTTFAKKPAGNTTYMVLRSDRRFLTYTFNLSMQRGELRFSLTHNEFKNNVFTTKVMNIPLGELDIFLNKKPLIQNLDYFVKFPEVVIVNRKFLNNAPTTPQEITVRFAGFCDSSLNVAQASDVGFIEYGVLSDNNTYDIRDDRVMRIVCDGKLKLKSDLVFSEDTSAISIINADNGKPYQIRDLISPMRGMTIEETYKLRDISRAIDKQVSDYLSMRIPEPDRGNLSVISQKYAIFSPFISKIIFDLRDNYLTVPIISGVYGRQFVTDTCKTYEYLLAFDPTQSPLTPNPRYVDIYPHGLPTVISLSAAKYKFVDEVISYYANGLITLSPFVSIA